MSNPTKRDKETMAHNERMEILDIIARAQEQSAPVTLMIGTTTEGNLVINQGVYIKDCPASVVTALTKAGWVLSMDDGYLHPIFKEVNSQ